jgi:hypothetical protein
MPRELTDETCDKAIFSMKEFSCDALSGIYDETACVFKEVFFSYYEIIDFYSNLRLKTMFCVCFRFFDGVTPWMS